MRYTKIIKENNLILLEGSINSLLNDELNIKKKFLGISTDVYSKKDGSKEYFAVVVLEDDHSKK